MKKDNKGFSLVELIIVIAIMAVLVGLLAPQYLKYVNNSKVSIDISNGQEIATVFNVAFADSVVTTADSPISTIDSDWGLSMTSFPDSKLQPGTKNWVVTLGDNGVSKVTLDGHEVWPDPKSGTKGAAGSGYYTEYHK